jgi:hypothetical protein
MVSLDSAAIRLLIALAKETQRVRPKGCEAKIISPAPEMRYEALAEAGFVVKSPYDLTGGICYKITPQGENHCRFVINSAELIQSRIKKRGRKNRENLS